VPGRERDAAEFPDNITMPFAVCRLSVVAVRSEPDWLSEMTSQVRGGEAVEILETGDGWWRVRMPGDGYEGWVNCRQFAEPSAAAPAAAAIFTDDLCGEARRGDHRIALPLGSPLAEFRDGRFKLGADEWIWAGTTRSIPAGPPDKPAMLAYARRFLSAPYQWGGRTVFGIDCSGFVQSVFAAFGVRLPRDSKEQVTRGTAVPDVSMAGPGDLAFFSLPDVGVHHVGLVLSPGEIIHASGMVRIDELSAEGIRNGETGRFSHRLAAVRRVL
jgi:cell wall-associated NlpC family hydrolase